jgi:1-acyl-sn-glycerol-3-phosphate acyltransferase
MTVDGFHSALAAPFVGWSPKTAVAFRDAVETVASYGGVELRGVDRLPKGRALLVTNHAFGFDALFPMMGIWRQTGRRVWVVGEHAWWKFPFLRRLAAAVGTVDGTPANVDVLLAEDELVLVLPGGLREAMKPRELSYRLLWGERYGFVRAAARAQAPIVPIASIGADELFHLVGDAFARGRRWLKRDFPIPMPARGVPWPHLEPWTYAIGEPIPPPPADASVEQLQRCRREVAGAIHELIDDELAVRRLGQAHATRCGASTPPPVDAGSPRS